MRTALAERSDRIMRCRKWAAPVKFSISRPGMAANRWPRMSSDGGGSEGDAKVDIDGLLEGALREMKLSEQQKHQQQQGHGKEQGRVQEQRGSSVAVSASAPIHDAHLQSMIEEFNSAATGNVGQEELPEKIDAALAKLLSIVPAAPPQSISANPSLRPTTAR